MSSCNNVIGIVGGMGPQAGVSLTSSILNYTDATIDQHHLNLILMSFPREILDRTSFLEDSVKTNPAYAISNIILNLEKAGANVAGMACNSAHAPRIFNVILNELHKYKSQVKLLHMPYETCKFIKNNLTDVRRVGIMGTNGTYKAKIYQDMLQTMGYDVVVPDMKFQNDTIHEIIYNKTYGIKANGTSISPKSFELLNKAIHFFKEQKSDAIILGCTELPLILNEKMKLGMHVISSTESMARALVREGAAFPKPTTTEGLREVTS